MQLEVKLTGIMSTMAVADGDRRARPHDCPRTGGALHQHMFNVRLDMQVDGPDNEVYEVDACHRITGSAENPWGNAFGTNVTLLETELAAQRDVDASRSRPGVLRTAPTTTLWRAHRYKLLPGATPTLLADPNSSVGRRAAFASHNLWVTPFDEEERERRRLPKSA